MMHLRFLLRYPIKKKTNLLIDYPHYEEYEVGSQDNGTSKVDYL